MKTLLQSLLVGFMITSLVACTSMRTVSDLPSNMQEKVHEGDRVHVWTNSGEFRKLTVTSIDEGVLNGTDTKAHQAVQIPRHQITRLDVRRTSFLKSMGLFVVVTYVIGSNLASPGP